VFVTAFATVTKMATGASGKWVLAIAGLAAYWVLVLPPKTGAAERQKFAALDRAATGIKIATVTGVSYKRFSELAMSLAVELLNAKEKIDGEEDRRLVLLYAQAGLAYGDSLTLWREKVERNSSQLPSTLAEISPLVSRYRIVVDGEPGDEHLDADSAIRLIWAAGNEALHKAELGYQGRDRELAAVLEAESRAEAERIAAEQRHAAAETEHQRAMAERVAEEFERAEREAKRPKPFEATVGNWTCPRGYVVRRGRCLSDEEIAHLPKMEVGR
jgi:hypothetical protein